LIPAYCESACIAAHLPVGLDYNLQNGRSVVSSSHVAPDGLTTGAGMGVENARATSLQLQKHESQDLINSMQQPNTSKHEDEHSKSHRRESIEILQRD